MNPYVHVYAVIRHDPYITSDIRGAITVVAVVPTAEEAREEVERLSEVNAKQSEYFSESARYYPEGRGAGASEYPTR